MDQWKVCDSFVGMPNSLSLWVKCEERRRGEDKRMRGGERGEEKSAGEKRREWRRKVERGVERRRVEVRETE